MFLSATKIQLWEIKKISDQKPYKTTSFAQKCMLQECWYSMIFLMMQKIECNFFASYN